LGGVGQGGREGGGGGGVGGEITEEWRKLHNVELYYLYSSTNTVQVIKSRMRWAGACSTYGGERRIQDFGGET
jgi:hypothetical protein